MKTEKETFFFLLRLLHLRMSCFDDSWSSIIMNNDVSMKERSSQSFVEYQFVENDFDENNESFSIRYSSGVERWPFSQDQTLEKMSLVFGTKIFVFPFTNSSCDQFNTSNWRLIVSHQFNDSDCDVSRDYLLIKSTHAEVSIEKILASNGKLFSRVFFLRKLLKMFDSFETSLIKLEIVVSVNRIENDNHWFCLFLFATNCSTKTSVGKHTRMRIFIEIHRRRCRINW